MDNQIDILTPQMRTYDDFDDARSRNYTPYLMYFHRTGYRSSVVNTDRLGFRMSCGARATASVATAHEHGKARLVAGASIGFGMRATCDEATIASRLWSEYAPTAPWLHLNGVRYVLSREPARPVVASRVILAAMDRRFFDVLLDEDPPRLVPAAAGSDDGWIRWLTRRRPGAPGFPFTVAPLDPEMFVLKPSSTHEVPWVLELDWTYQGHAGTVTVDCAREPFRVHPG